MKSFKMATAASLTLFLIACGSSDSSEDDSTGGTGGVDTGSLATTPFTLEGPDPSSATDGRTDYSITGVVTLSEPVAGAEVCIDTTFDGSCDQDSPVAYTDGSGRYEIHFTAPYAYPEFFIRASIADFEAVGPDHALNFLTKDNTVELVSRGFNEGQIDLITTLEALQYNPDLNYLQQTDLYAWARTQIMGMYMLGQNVGMAQAQSSLDTNHSAALQYELHNDIYEVYSEALQYVNSPAQALALTATNPKFTSISHLAEWHGFTDATPALTAAQVQRIEDGFFADSGRATLSVIDSYAEVIHEVANSALEAYYEDGSVTVYKHHLHNYHSGVSVAQQCWSETNEAWSTFGGAFDDYTVERVSDSQYSFVNPITGQSTSFHFDSISPADQHFSDVTGVWTDLLDFDVALVDGELVRARYEYSDEMCYTRQTWRQSTESARFSDMEGLSVARVINSVAADAGMIEVDEDLQRIILTSSGYIYDYRIAVLGERELLYVYPVHASAMGSYPLVFEWMDGEHRSGDFTPATRYTLGFSGISVFMLDDAIATDIKAQLESL